MKKAGRRPGGYDRNPYWDEGDISRLANVANLDITDISAILHRRRNVSVRKAYKLHEAAAAIGYDIPWTAFADNSRTKHPAFYGDPTI